MTPTVGRIVLVPVDPAKNNGADVAPAIITRVWNDTCVNVRALLDGTDTLWLSSAVRVDELPKVESGEAAPRCWAWPPRA